MKFDPGKALMWSEIDQAPDTSGVYAWYSRLLISKADVENVVQRTIEAKLAGDPKTRSIIEEALDRFIFKPYCETPYQVTLSGKLKPKYVGVAEHNPNKSDSLLERMVDDPSRIRLVTQILRTAAPWFTAPLYIGMASNLKTRLIQHRNKIVELRELRDPFMSEESVEAGFANQIVSRNFDPTNLFVHIAEIDCGAGEHNDIENILNRINYPIFGRN
jgi:hypothetical protein